MGCDGGSIPKRHEVVKSKKNDGLADKSCELSSKWQYCPLSGMKLNPPIVACQLGRLYNKEAIIEYILALKSKIIDSDKFKLSKSTYSNVRHIKSMKDVKELKLKPLSSKEGSATSASSSSATLSNVLRSTSSFVCPITNLEMNGRYKFVYFLKCGCVCSERALKQVPDKERCLMCSAKHDASMDIITINGNPKEFNELMEKMKKRKLSKQEKLKKVIGS